MDPFLPNDVLNYLYTEVQSLFASGSPTATIYLEPPEEPEVDFSQTSEIVLSFVSEENLTNDFCGNHGAWEGGRVLVLQASILSRDRYTAQAVWGRLDTYMAKGRFQYPLLTPASTNSQLFYTEFLGTDSYFVESELFGLLAHFNLYMFRTYDR